MFRFLFSLTLLIFERFEGKEFKIGALFTSNRCCDFQSFEDKASALNIAVDRLYDHGVLDPDTVRFRFLWGDTYDVPDAFADVMEYINDVNVDLILGPPSSSLTIPAAYLTGYYNIPHVTWLSNSKDLNNKTLFPTLVRTVGMLSDIGKVVVTLYKKFGWMRGGVLFVENELCQIASDDVAYQFVLNNFTLATRLFIQNEETLTDNLIDSFLVRLKRTVRVVFFCDSNSIRPLIVRACKLGMCNGDYAFIYGWASPPPEKDWYRGDKDDFIAKKGFRYVIYISLGNWRGSAGQKDVEAFEKEVLERMVDPPWNSTIARDHELPVGTFTGNLYESMYLYGVWLNHTIATKTDQKNGRAWLNFCRDISFPGIGSTSDIGPNGDRLPFFWIYQFKGANAEAVMVAESIERNSKLVLYEEFEWATKTGHPPPDTPACGFLDNLCQSPIKKDYNTAVVLSSTTVFAVVCIAVIAWFVVRRKRFEKQLLQSIWKINVSEIEILKSKSGFGSRLGPSSGSALCSAVTSREGSNLPPLAQSSVKPGRYRTEFVVIKPIARRAVLTRQELKHLTRMRMSLHVNVNSFVGACFEDPTPCMVFLYCSKGSLQDILENDEIQLDSTWKISLTMDLIAGMIYMHNSSLGCHGSLKSSNCLVDNRWMLRVTDYGVERFRNLNISSDQRCKGLLWTAPEILRDPQLISHGTKKGDVYSFAIILHEMFFRMGPFAGHGLLSAEEIVDRVKGRLDPPFRPVVFSDQPDVSSQVVKIIEACWQEIPIERPTFTSIREVWTKRVQNGRVITLVDMMLHRLEKYANNLEGLVDQRTQQLVQEKHKSDKLLYRMMPKSCAEKLKKGENLVPTMYQSATLSFSDIVGFTIIASLSTPLEVVDFLNDLYTCFDELITTYDAYKVETIGDAYLVVSGIPIRNGERHAGVIADMSLDVIRMVRQFRIAHLPEKRLEVRIGVHTGPCCAGVVGRFMPRYCLFGDTVNTASRMESSGEAGKIHLSENTHVVLQKQGVYKTEFRGELDIKGKGLMRTYWLHGKKGNDVPSLKFLFNETKT